MEKWRPNIDDQRWFSMIIISDGDDGWLNDCDDQIVMINDGDDNP